MSTSSCAGQWAPACRRAAARAPAIHTLRRARSACKRRRSRGAVSQGVEYCCRFSVPCCSAAFPYLTLSWIPYSAAASVEPEEYRASPVVAHSHVQTVKPGSTPRHGPLQPAWDRYNPHGTAATRMGPLQPAWDRYNPHGTATTRVGPLQFARAACGAPHDRPAPRRIFNIRPEYLGVPSALLRVRQCCAGT